MSGPSYLLQKQAEEKNRILRVAERMTRQFDTDTLQVTLHREFGWGYDRLRRLDQAWAETRKEFKKAMAPKDPECDVAQEHLDDALRDICQGHQDLVPCAQRYPELKEVRYDGKQQQHHKK